MRRLSAWGAQTRSSRRSFVFVEQSAEEVAPPDVTHVEGRCGRRIVSAAAVRRSQVERSVRTLLVEVADVDAQDVLELAATEDREPVETLPAHAADPAFGVGVRVRRLDRRSDDLDAFAAEDAVEGTAELCVPIVDQEARPPARSSRSISRLRACWVIHDVSGVLVQATYSTRRVPIETKKSTYSRRSQTVSQVNKSQARIEFRC
jgi:hypothetical protein